MGFSFPQTIFNRCRHYSLHESVDCSRGTDCKSEFKVMLQKWVYFMSVMKLERSRQRSQSKDLINHVYDIKQWLNSKKIILKYCFMDIQIFDSN